MNQNFPRLTAAIQRGIASGLHIGAVIHVRQHGHTVADIAMGAAALQPHQALRSDQRLLWMSAGKPLTALAIGILADRGRLQFDRPVVDFLPEFADHEKGDITLRHLLNHTHAYKPPPLDWPRQPREAIIQKICREAAPLPGTRPGAYAAYDPQSSWYLLSEIIERITGMPFHEFIRAELLEPIGCTGTSIGMSSEEWTALRNAGELAVLHDTTGSAREQIDLTAAAGGEPWDASHPDPIHHPAPWAGDDARRAPAHNPGGGAVGPASDLSLLYQFVLQGGITAEGVALLRETTIEEMTRRQRIGLKDNSFGQVIDWGLGFLINSARYGNPGLPYGYGPYASDGTFGHGGMQSSGGFADPEHGLAGAVIFNGLPGEPKHQKRTLEVMTALYEDLGLTNAAIADSAGRK